jgi:flagellar motor component MotA
MIKKQHYFFFTISIAFIWFGLYTANIDMSLLISFSSLFFLTGILFGLMTMAFPIKTHMDALRAFFSGKIPDGCNPEEFVRYFRSLSYLAIIAGFLGFLITMAMLLERLNSPEELGPPVAIGIRCLAYGVIVHMLAISISEGFRLQSEKSADALPKIESNEKTGHENDRHAA